MVTKWSQWYWGPRLRRIKQKQKKRINIWISMKFFLFYTTQPNSPVWIFIIQNWSVTMGLWLCTVLGSFSSRTKSQKPIDTKQIQLKKQITILGKKEILGFLIHIESSLDWYPLKWTLFYLEHLLLLNRMEKKCLWVSSLYQLSLMLFFWLVEIFIMEMEGGWHDSTSALLL